MTRPSLAKAMSFVYVAALVMGGMAYAVATPESSPRSSELLKGSIRSVSASSYDAHRGLHPLFSIDRVHHGYLYWSAHWQDKEPELTLSLSTSVGTLHVDFHIEPWVRVALQDFHSPYVIVSCPSRGSDREQRLRLSDSVRVTFSPACRETIRLRVVGVPLALHRAWGVREIRAEP